ncbi:MAG: long-chain-fatty-acid--CoA ligase [Haloarculaceae archaeon]
MSSHPTLGTTLEQSAARVTEKDALVYPRRDQRYSYAEFDASVNRLANALADLGVEKGDRVSTMLYNGTELPLTVYACAKLGAVFNPMNYRLPAGEVEFIANDAGSSVMVYEADTAEAVEGARSDLETVEEYVYVPDPGEERSGETLEGTRGFYALLESGRAERPDTDVHEDDTYGLMYTSGTTGRPKGVVHTHRDMVEHSVLALAECGLRHTDTGLSVMPLYHAAELHARLFPLVHRGCTNVVYHEFEPAQTLRAVEEHEVTTMFLAPTAWNAAALTAAEGDFDVSSLRIGLYGAAPMPGQVLENCREHLCEDYVQAYGMTEIGPAGVFLYEDEQEAKQGAAGRPGLNHDVRVVEPGGDPDATVRTDEVGEILLWSTCLMTEYWNRPDATDESIREDPEGRTWYYTGDLGRVDDDGYLYVVDRKDDMIISGGENVYPTEVENVLFTHEDVVEAAVVGEPDEEWGERIVAYVVGDATAEELDAFVRDSDDVADFKRPRAYYFVDELPKNPSGKVQKFRLRSDEDEVGAVEGEEVA